MAPFPRALYEAPAEQVARQLLGRILVHDTPEGLCAGAIVETEAYLAHGDPGCHAARGKTPRNAPMFDRPGTAYVYFIYGMHYCLNVVTAPEGTPEAVLIRALEPLEGIEIMSRRRGVEGDRALCSGPAKLCQALGVDVSLNRADLTRPPLFICDSPGGYVPPGDGQITVTTRVGLPAGKGDELALRYYITGNRFISRR